MHEDNIKLIMGSDLWRRMKRNKNYLGYKIIHRDRGRKGFQCLWVFFEWRVRDTTIKRYHKEGSRMSKGEGLTPVDEVPLEYGIKILLFS